MKVYAADASNHFPPANISKGARTRPKFVTRTAALVKAGATPTGANAARPAPGRRG